jgi:hypothetical protein
LLHNETVTYPQELHLARLLGSWNEHQQLRQSDASIAELSRSRAMLDRIRFERPE